MNDNGPLTIGVSTRALFDLRAEHEIFEKRGIDAYVQLQREREETILEKGTAFDVVERLLALNPKGGEPLVRVVLLSQNSPDLSLRAFNSVDHYGLDVELGSFTSGRCVAPFIGAWGIDLFLSNEEADVAAVVQAGTAAAKLQPPPERHSSAPIDEVCFAFDGDAVLFDAASERIYQEQGLEAFKAHEREHAKEPMNPGPFRAFFQKLAALRQSAKRPDGESRVRIVLVTARSHPAHARAVHTFRAWGTPADEAHFVGLNAKGPFLKAVDAHIFFDDQLKHVAGASNLVPAGLVPLAAVTPAPSQPAAALAVVAGVAQVVAAAPVAAVPVAPAPQTPPPPVVVPAALAPTTPPVTATPITPPVPVAQPASRAMEPAA